MRQKLTKAPKTGSYSKTVLPSPLWDLHRGENSFPACKFFDFIKY